MASALTVSKSNVESGTLKKLDSTQTLKASSALLKHIRTKAEAKEAISKTMSLLPSERSSTNDSSPSDTEAIWLVLTGKKFLADKRNLKPRKIALPHSLYTSPSTSICLITPEPQRLFKDAIAHPSFPTHVSKCITRVIDLKKLEAKYYSFESKRQLRDSFDLFLSDDRIITYLSKILGATFYKTTSKRPIPVLLEAPKTKQRENAALPSAKARKNPSDLKSVAAPSVLAKEIERTLSTAQVHISPSTTTSVRVGNATFNPQQLAENIEAVVNGLVGKLVAWRNIRAVHIKGPNTMALPIWLAHELWADEGMVLEEAQALEAKTRGAQQGKRKREMVDEGQDKLGPKGTLEVKKHKSFGVNELSGKSKTKKALKLKDEDLGQERRERREKLRLQKKEAREKIEGKALTKSAPSVDEQSSKRKQKKQAAEFD